MSGIGVVTNPRSRHNRRNPQLSRSLAYVLGERGQLEAPADLDALAVTAAGFRDRGLDLLCINGGDGTVHQALTAMVRAYGEDRPLPPVALLRGGTMNIVADSVGVRLDPETALGRVVEAFHEGERMPSTVRRLMRLTLDDRPPYYGFLSGNGIIARFLEVYYEKTDPTPIDAARLLLRGSMSALVGGPLIRRLTRPWDGVMTADGVQVGGGRWVAIALGTVEQMGLGFQVFSRIPDHPDRLQYVALGGSVADLARELPSLYRGRGVHRPGDSTGLASSVELTAPEPIQLMIDGDFYVASGGRVRVELGPPVTFLQPG